MNGAVIPVFNFKFRRVEVITTSIIAMISEVSNFTDVMTGSSGEGLASSYDGLDRIGKLCEGKASVQRLTC